MFTLCHFVLRGTFQSQNTHVRISSKIMFLWWVKVLTLYEVGIYHYFYLLELESHWGSTVGLLLLLCFNIGLAVEYSQRWILIYMLLCWFIDEQTSFTRTEQLICLWNTSESRVRVTAAWNKFKPQVIYYWRFQGGVSVVVYSNCICSSASCYSLTICSLCLR